MVLPAGYRVVAAPRVRAAIRDDLVPALAPWLLAPRLEAPPGSEPFVTGRGAAYRARLDGLSVVVRPCRRGGLVGRVVRETYVGLQPRPFRELAVTAEARRRGVSAAEILAVRVTGGFLYQGAVVTAEVPAAATLLDALRAAPDARARCGLAAVAGRAVATLHAAGVFHADLNLNNILVHPGTGGLEATLLDFDGARLAPPPLGPPSRRRNLARLARSLRKLDPTATLAGAAERRAFHAGYEERLGKDGVRCAC